MRRRSRHTLNPLATALPVLASIVTILASPAAIAQTVFLEGGRVIPVVGPPLNKANVLIKNGKIAEIGPEVKAPFDAKVYDVSGKTLFPGMIDVHTNGSGVDRANETPPVTPFLNVYDAIDPSQLFYEDALRDGVLALHVIQGNNCAIGAMSRVVRPIGMTPNQMTIAADVALKMSITPKSGFDRMMQMATLREAFRKLADDMEQLAEKKYEDSLRERNKPLDVSPDEARKRGKEMLTDEDTARKNRSLLQLTRGKLRVFVYCRNAMDVAPAVKLAKANGFFDQTVFVLGTECYKAVDELEKAGRPVVLDANLIHRETDPISGKEKETFVPKVFDKTDLNFALQRRPGSSLGERYLWYQAARCVREGMDRDKALKTITLYPAQMIGLADRLGSLEVGKDANILVLSGDPLDAQTWVEHGFIEGVHVYDRDKDIRLKQLLSSPKEELKGPAAAETAEKTGDKKTKGKNG